MMRAVLAAVLATAVILPATVVTAGLATIALISFSRSAAGFCAESQGAKASATNKIKSFIGSKLRAR